MSKIRLPKVLPFPFFLINYDRVIKSYRLLLPNDSSYVLGDFLTAHTYLKDVLTTDDDYADSILFCAQNFILAKVIPRKKRVFRVEVEGTYWQHVQQLHKEFGDYFRRNDPPEVTVIRGQNNAKTIIV